MNGALEFPSWRSIAASTIVLSLALGLTLLSFVYQGYEQLNAGHSCGIYQDEPCIAIVASAGLPLEFMVDQLGTSAMGVLGFEDFLIVPFLFDLVFYVLILGGIWFFVGRRHFWSFWAPIALLASALAGFVLRSAVMDPAVATTALNGGIILGVIGALIAISGALVVWNEMGLPIARTLLKFLMGVAMPGFICGLFAGGLFEIMLQWR